MHTPEPARLGAPLVGGMGPAWAAMEALNRNLSAGFGPRGVRAICIRSTGLPETATIEVVFGLHANTLGITREHLQFIGSDRDTPAREHSQRVERQSVTKFEVA
jgi:hypothetical protein